MPKGGENSTTCAENRTIFVRKCAAFSAKLHCLSRAHAPHCANIHKLSDLSATMICKIGFLDIVKLRDDGC